VPKVSIIMNCYNGEKYLKEAINSIYAQTFKDWEIIFWDNASTDSSKEIAKSYDNKLRYFHSKDNYSLGKARRLAMEQAEGEWVGFLDVDDLWYPNKLETQIKELDRGKYILCYAGIREINPNGSLIREIIPRYKSGWQLKGLLLQFDINMVTPLINKEILDRSGICFDDYIVSSEEYDLFMRLAAKGKFCTLSKVLGAYRVSSDSLTDRSIKHWYSDRIRTLDKLKRENPGLELRFKKEFEAAYIRGRYFYSRYLMAIENKYEAKKVLSDIKHSDWRYYALWIISHVKFLWNIIHSQFFKRKFLPRLLKITKSPK
jgi:glycosyltransferase involved in cell wall biosynthesis